MDRIQISGELELKRALFVRSVHDDGHQVRGLETRRGLPLGHVMMLSASI